MMKQILFVLLSSAILPSSFARADEPKVADKQEASDKNEAKVESSAPKKVPYEALNPDERDLLNRGEISPPAYIIGGILSVWPGFGIGHAIQGRYSEKGWIYTVGELGSIAVAAIGATQCVSTVNCSSTTAGFVVGGLAYIGFRIWEIIDAGATPPEINSRYRALKERVGFQKTERLYLSATALPYNGSGLGLTFRF